MYPQFPAGCLSAMANSEFDVFEDDDFLQLESVSRSMQNRPYLSGQRPMKTCYLRGMTTRQFYRLKLPDDLGVDEDEEANDFASQNSSLQHSPQVWLTNWKNAFESFGRRSSRFHSFDIDGDSNDSEEKNHGDVGSGMGGNSGKRFDRVDVESYLDQCGSSDVGANDDYDEDDVSLHGSLSTISSLEESDFTRLTQEEKRRRDVKSKRKEERRIATKKERAKDEENYKNIIAFANKELGRKEVGESNQRRHGDNGKWKSSEAVTPDLSLPPPLPSVEHRSSSSSKRHLQQQQQQQQLDLTSSFSLSSPNCQNNRFSITESQNYRCHSPFLHSSSLTSPHALSPNANLSELLGCPSPPDPRAHDSEAEVLPIPSEFMKSFAPPDLTFDSFGKSPSASPRLVDFGLAETPSPRELSAASPQNGREIPSPMALFRASFDNDDPYAISASASVNTSADAPALDPVTPAFFKGNRSLPQAKKPPQNHSFLPRSFEKKRAILTRPDEKGLFEGDLLRQYPRREKTERNRVPTGNTVKIEFLPRCMNLIQLKDILDFAGSNAIIKIKLAKEDSTTTAHVKFRDEAIAVNVISFLDGCVLRTTDRPLSCSLT